MKFSNIFNMVLLAFGFSNALASGVMYTGNCTFRGYGQMYEDCLKSELDVYDKELNALYKSTTQKSPSKLLKEAEIAWLKFRKTDCHYIRYEVMEGRDSSINLICYINVTKTRINDLKKSFGVKWY